MKPKILLPLIISVLLLLVSSAFAQRAEQDNNAPMKFRNAADRDGLNVTPGSTSRKTDNLPTTRHTWQSLSLTRCKSSHVRTEFKYPNNS